MHAEPVSGTSFGKHTEADAGDKMEREEPRQVVLFLACYTSESKLSGSVLCCYVQYDISCPVHHVVRVTLDVISYDCISQHVIFLDVNQEGSMFMRLNTWQPVLAMQFFAVLCYTFG
jgi:hypothetical protein